MIDEKEVGPEYITKGTQYIKLASKTKVMCSGNSDSIIIICYYYKGRGRLCEDTDYLLTF